MALPFAFNIPYLVSHLCPLKFNITTIKDTSQKAEIINTTERMVHKTPMISSSCLLQVSYTFLLIVGTQIFCGNIPLKVYNDITVFSEIKLFLNVHSLT